MENWVFGFLFLYLEEVIFEFENNFFKVFV